MCGHAGATVESDTGTPVSPFASAQSENTQRAATTKQGAQQSQRSAVKPFNVIAAAKARVRELDAEITRLQKLKTERDQLKRLLAAATQKTGAVVPLRKAQ